MWEKGGGLDLKFCPQTRRLRLRLWSNPHLILLLARMGVGGAKL